MTTPTDPPVTTSVLREALLKRHDPAEWQLFHEVSFTNTGRRADVLALNLWVSRGHVLHGYEVKASRNDWLRELKTPGKADGIVRYCAQWSLATAPGIVKSEEVPYGWGLLEWSGKKWATRVAPPRHEPQSLPTSLWVSLFKAYKRPGADELVRARQEAVSDYRRTQERANRESARSRESRVAGDARVLESLGIFRHDQRLEDPEWVEAVRTFLAADSVQRQARDAVDHVRARLATMLKRLDEGDPDGPR